MHKYIYLHKKIELVDKFLKNNDLSKISKGSYEIEGRNVYVNIDEYETKEINASIPEAHREYLDIQIVLSGKEKIGYAPYKRGKTEIEYNKEKDIEFLSSDCEYLKAYPNRFFIFFPQDIHHPCITDTEKNQIKKAVFKIKL